MPRRSRSRDLSEPTSWVPMGLLPPSASSAVGPARDGETIELQERGDNG